MRGKFRDFPSIILPIFLAFPPNFGGNDFFKISPSYEVDFPPNRLFWAKFPPNFGGEQNRFPPRIMKIENVGGETCSPPFWGEKGGGEILEVAGNFFFCSPQKTGGNAYYAHVHCLEIRLISFHAFFSTCGHSQHFWNTKMLDSRRCQTNPPYFIDHNWKN